MVCADGESVDELKVERERKFGGAKKLTDGT